MGPLVVLGFFLGMVALAIRQPRTALLVTVFFAAWSGFDVDFGLRVSAYQITVAAVLAVTAVRSLQPGWRPQRVAAVRLLAAFLVLGVTLSLCQLAFLPDADLTTGVWRSPLVRAPIQIALLAFALAPVVLIGWSMKTVADIKSMLRVYLLSIVVLAVIGWIQLILWYRTGVNPLPIGIVNDWLGGADITREGLFDFGSLAIYRMNSLAGEPRQLGGALVLAMMAIQAIALTARRVEWRWMAPLWLFFLVTAVATYSTSAVAIWLIGTTVQFVTPWVFGVKIRRSIGQLGGAVLVTALPILLAIGAAEANGIPVVDLIADRTVNRIDQNGAVEDFDLAILDFFKAHPEYLAFGTGLGNAHLYAAPYIQPEFRWYAEGNVFTAKPQYLRIVSELGLAGLLLFMTWFGVLLIDVARVLRRPGGDEVVSLVPIAITMLVVFMADGSVAGEFWAVASALAVAVTALRAQPAPRPFLSPAPVAALPA